MMMNKQDPRIYRSHMDRMAFALFLNQGVILVFGALIAFFRFILSNDGSLSEQNEVLLLTLESIAYILGFMW